MTFLAVMRSDYLQRFRAPKFWLVLLAFAFIAFLMFPGANAKYAVMSIYGFRGFYTSTWIGDTLAVLNGMMLPLFSFYIIKNAVSLDRNTKVDLLLKSSLLKNRSYLFGKWLSNSLLVFTLILLMNVVAIFKQFYLGESYEIDLIAHFQGQILFAVPAVFLTASLALLFESTPGLRGGFGNLIYVYVWMPLVVFQMMNDFGAKLIITQMETAVDKVGRINDGVTIGGMPIDAPLATFAWHGIQPTSSLLLSGLLTIAFAVLLLLLSLMVFKQCRGPVRRPKFLRRKTKKLLPITSPRLTTLTPLVSRRGYFGVFHLLRGELRLMFRSHKLFWYGGAAILTGLSLALPLDPVIKFVLPVTALWGTLIFSQLGCRDFKNHTEVLTGCTSFGESVRLSAGWFSGVILQLTLFAGLLIRFNLEGQMPSAQILLVAALFIPAMAICLGRISSTSRTFEFLFMLLWYIGPLDNNPPFDFLGTTITTAPPQVMTFLTATVIFMAITLLIGQKDRIIRAFA